MIYGPTPDRSVPVADDDAGSIALDPANVLPRRVAWWAQRDPHRPFVVEVTGRRATYGQVLDGIRRWCTILQHYGVRRGERILSLLPSSIDAHLLWMAAGCIGAVEVPVNPELRGEFLHHALTDPQARLCFARPETAGVPRQAGIDELEVVVVDREGGLAAEVPPAAHVTWPEPVDPACVIYTSGTTGPAKGVVVSWAQMAASIGRIPRSWFSAEDAVYSCHPMFHVTGRTPLHSMADVGGRVVLRERFSVKAFWDDVRTHGCTSTTAIAPLLLGVAEAHDDRDNPLRVVFGGPSGQSNLRFAERFGVHVVSSYGSTEAGFPIVQRWPSVEGRRSCGWLRRGYEARITDDQARELPPGVVGELWVKAGHRALITLGYLGRPDLTERAAVDGWYRTGDALVRHPDGSFEFVDRLRDTIRRLGENISSSALETVVVGDPDVLECVAIGVPNAVTGQDILLAVVPRPNADLEPEVLFRRLEDQLPRYMHPAYIVVRPNLPRTANGKARKAGLLAELDLDAAWRSAASPGAEPAARPTN